MASERALGMTDAQYKLAPNATQGFVNGKVKSSLNRTLEWLEQREDREKLVAFAVREGHLARQRETRRKVLLERDLKRRQDVSRQQRDTVNRKKIASAVRSAISAEHFSASLASFQFSEETLTMVEQIAKCPTSIIGQLIEHAWFDLEKGEELWFGRASEVEAEKRGKRKTTEEEVYVSIAYWNKMDVEANAEDYSIPLEEILVDTLLGDLCFVH